MDDQLSHDDEIPILEEVIAYGPNAVPPQRIWTVFVAYLAAFVGAIVLQVIAAVLWIAWHVAQGGDAQQIQRELPEMMTNPVVFLALAAMSQLAILVAALSAAWFSPEPTFRRLGMVKPKMPVWGYPVMAIGAIFPFAIGIELAIELTKLIVPGENVQQLYQKMTWELAGPFILFIALAPGLCEELLFRGYMQRRLLQCWSPGLAIFVTSALFAILHLMPHQVVFAFVVGLWLGVIAWRTGSVWPGVVCHAFINGSWNVWQIGVMLEVFPERPPDLAVGIVGSTVLVCFALSVWLLIWPRDSSVAERVSDF